MKKLILLAVILLGSNSLSAQNLNGIVKGTLKNVPDGWHKFTYQGISYDVGVEDEFLTQGNIVWFDNSRYSGAFNGYNISGKGTYVWPNKERYEGRFKNNMRHGYGTMYYKDGTYFYGKWKNNRKNGKGQEYDKNGILVRDGVWKNDVFVKTSK